MVVVGRPLFCFRPPKGHRSHAQKIKFSYQAFYISLRLDLRRIASVEGLVLKSLERVFVHLESILR